MGRRSGGSAGAEPVMPVRGRGGALKTGLGESETAGVSVGVALRLESSLGSPAGDGLLNRVIRCSLQGVRGRAYSKYPVSTRQPGVGGPRHDAPASSPEVARRR